jgi:hypothetical protein
MDNTSKRQHFMLASFPATWKQLLTEQNVFRALTLILFCSVTFSLLFFSHFLPFGIDNNETFSSILHAKNMYLHGIGSTYGLTSETTSPADTVQYVYTHQGNFPRFYALLLYALGARSAEAQILITTLTIGSASILFAHIYMELRVNAPFAFIFCSVLVMDYIMGLQWFVNTWRVWHFFFFFSTLLLAHAFAEASSKIPRMLNCSLLLINFACLFYFEIIFAMFVAIFFVLYLTFLLWRQPRRLLLGLAVSGVGSVLAICILLLQIFLYLGWEGFLTDLRYTFFSRNAAPGDLAVFRERVLGFMREHNIVFWDNFTSAASGLNTPSEMLRLFFRFNLAPQTPMLVLLSFLLTAGAWLHAAANALQISSVPISDSPITGWMRKTIQPENGAALLIPAFVFFGLIVILSGTSYGITDSRDHLTGGSSIRFITVSLIIASAAVLFLSVCWRFVIVKTRVLCAAAYQRLGPSKVPAIILLVTVISSVPHVYGLIDPSIVLLSVLAGASLVLWVVSARCALSNARIVIATGFLIFFAVFAHYHAWLYQPIHSDIAPNYFEPFWSEFIAKRGGPTFWKITIVATGFLSTLIILGLIDDAKSPRSVVSLARVAPYWLIGILAYVIVFIIASGYVYTAYQIRTAPLAVFFTVLPGACAIYVLCSVAQQLAGKFMSAYRAVAVGRTVVAGAQASLVCGLLVTIAVTWLALQSTYLRRIPPNRFASLFHALKNIAGASTVVNAYATPVAIATGQWSYFDLIFFREEESFDNDGYHVSPQDFRYLWFSDWKSNSAYRRPDYFVCWLHLSFYNVVSPTDYRRHCGINLTGVRNIREGKTVFDHKEVFRDQKYDLWSIVKLDWDYPPYLHPLDESFPDTKVRATPIPRRDGIGFIVEISPTQQEGRPIVGVQYRLRVEEGDQSMCEPSPRRLFQLTDNPADLLLPKNFKGCVQISVSPITATKIGSEYYSEKMR